MKEDKILLVDDDPLWIEKVKNILTKKYDVITAENTKEAIKAVKLSHYNLVIIDMHLDGDPEGGIDLIIKMRKIIPALRAIILTGYDKSALAVLSIQAGALDYITKDSEEILAPKLMTSIEKNKKLTKVFLSYDRRDLKKVSGLYKKLTKGGFLPWMDKYDMRAGKWEPQIKKAINVSNFFIACLSPNSVDKKIGFVKKELNFALEKQAEFDDDAGYIIPARLVECSFPESLKDFHGVDLFKEIGFFELVTLMLPKQ